MGVIIKEAEIFMSTIITASGLEGRFMMMFNAPDVRTFVRDTDFDNWIFDITGEAERPFICGVRFINCKIIADNLRSFDSCYFNDDCEMLVKDMPVANYQSINNNRVLKAADKPTADYKSGFEDTSN